MSRWFVNILVIIQCAGFQDNKQIIQIRPNNLNSKNIVFFTSFFVSYDTTASGPKWAGTDIVDFSSFCRAFARPLSLHTCWTLSIGSGLFLATVTGWDPDSLAFQSVIESVATPAGEFVCACEWVRSSHFYSLCLLLLRCQSRCGLLMRVIIFACGIWHLSTGRVFVLEMAHKRPV